jgi:hypothetical protein
MVGALIGAIVIVAAINLTVNPYGAWPLRAFDPIYRRITLERLAIPYMLQIARPRTLLIGSSRVILGMRIEQGERDGVLNAAMSGANLEEIGPIIELARRNRDLKRIIWGVEFFAFNGGEDGKPDTDTLERIEAPWKTIVPDTLASAEALDRSRELYRRSAQGRARLPAESTQPIPWSAEFIGTKMTALQRESRRPDEAVELRQARQFRSWYDGYRLSRDEIKLFREIVERIRAANIELILFVPPTSEYELEMIRQSGLWEQFQAWKAAVAQVSPFWDFSGFNRIARTDELFIDVMHFRPELGFSIMRRLEGESCDKCGPLADEAVGEALYFDRPTAAANLAEQNSRMAKREREDTVYARVAREVIAEPGEARAGAADANLKHRQF